jgi:cytochrome P450
MTQAQARTAARAEIDFSIYNPYDIGWVREPFETLDRLLNEYPVAYHTDIKAWMVSPHDLALEVLRSPRFSTRFTDWNQAPPPKPEREWNLFDQAQALSLGVVPAAEHLRLRRLTAPAFSRRVMDRIEATIADAIVDVFDEIENPKEFNVATELARKIPVRSIARMVGVPPEASELFEHSLAWNLVRANNPMYSKAEREQFGLDSIPGFQYLLDVIAERRTKADPGRDFIGTLISTVEDGEHLSDWEIVAVITALVVAGADTAVDLHTYALYALLLHPDQRRLLRQQPELMDGAILEILRWASNGKFGAIPRFPLEDIELGGQTLEQGSFVMPLFAPAWSDPKKWPEPRRFDITRNHAGNIIFGAGPHLCIGLNLVKVQGKLMIEEFDRRFGDSVELTGDIVYDPLHFNSRRMTSLMVSTAG